MNSSIRKIILSLIILLLLSACADASTGYTAPDWEQIPDPLPESLKGYELYSWQAGGEWLFTLTTGTNRIKSFEEITSIENKLEDGFVKVTVNSSDDLVKLIEHLPAGVDLIWSGINLSGEVEEGTLYFTYPPADIMEKVVKAAAEQGVQLHTLQTPCRGAYDRFRSPAG